MKEPLHPIKKSVLTGAITFVSLLVLFWPTIDKCQAGYGNNKYLYERIYFHGSGPLSMSWVFGFAMGSGVLGMIVWSLSGKKNEPPAP